MELTEALLTELGRFLDSEGRLTLFPSKTRYKVISLFYLSTKFETGRSYTEKEVNEIIDRYHTFQDKWLLRRELINKGLLSRFVDGSKYWLTEEQPRLEDLLS